MLMIMTQDTCFHLRMMIHQSCKLAAFCELKVDVVLETKLDRKFQLVIDKGTLDAIGLHPDGSVKRIMYWDSISNLVAPGGQLVITSCNSMKEELVQEVDNFNQRSFAASQEPECPVNQEACRDTPQFCHLDHIRSCPTFMFGGSPVQTNLTISLAAPSGILNLFPAGVFEEMDSSKTISSFQQGSRSLHLLPKAPKPVLAAGLDTNASSISQIHVARPPVEGRIKNQLLPHYWPR